MSLEWATVKEKVEWHLKLAETRYNISGKDETKREIDDLSDILEMVHMMAPDNLLSKEEYIQQFRRELDEFDDELKRIGKEFPNLKTKQKQAV